MKTILFAVLLSSFSMVTFAQTKVAVVKLMRGEAHVLTLGKTSPIKKDDWIEEGSVVKTSEKSFVKLSFIDKSEMNIAANSEMKIETFSGKDSGVIDLVKGQIRSQVTKDYLQMDKNKSKVFIKTQNAVMGVRGTDFLISTNGQNTTTILFEGEVVFNKFDHRGDTSSTNLEKIVDAGVRIMPGEFSVMEANRPEPTVPAVMNVQQREHLEKNADFSATRTPSSATTNDSAKSVVPDGLSGKQVSNSVDILKSEVAQVAPAPEAPVPAAPASDPNGFVNGDHVKPANGSFVHVETGVIIPPAEGSVLDTNTNTYIPSAASGHVAEDGSFVPPKNVEITSDGKILVTSTDDSGKRSTKEVQSSSLAGPSPASVASAPAGGDIPLSFNPENKPVSGGLGIPSADANTVHTNATEVRKPNVDVIVTPKP